MAKDLSAGLKRRQGRRFGLTVGAAFVVLAGIALWRDNILTARILAAPAAMLFALAAVAPRTLLAVESVWMRAAHLLSRVTTPIILGAFYFLILTPIGLTRRVFGRRGLPRSQPGQSMWTERAEGFRRSDLTRQF